MPKKSVFRRIIHEVKDRIAPFFPYQTYPGDKISLDREYADGVWDYLADIEELPRFSAIIGYCQYYKKSPAILELGCGEGLLQQRMCSSAYEIFVGVDISPEAIKRATRNGFDRSRFIAADASVFVPDGRYDIIIFNDVLNYFSYPTQQIKRYAESLRKDGILIAGIYANHWHSVQICKMIDRHFDLLSESIVMNRNGVEWNIKVFRPKN